MESNKFIIEPFTGENVDSIPAKEGQGIIDCNYQRVLSDLVNSTSNYDNTNDKPIYKAEFVYLSNFPSKVISYDNMVEYGKDKYYWDSLNQRLYTFKVTDDVTPFIEENQIIKGTGGNPTQVISVLNEFSKGDGIFNEVTLDLPTSNYIIVHGHPEQYAQRPYNEDIYYYDDVHNKYYTFISYYTININNWYYDNTVSDSVLLKYTYESRAWTTVNKVQVLNGDPNTVIHVVDDNTTDGAAIDIDDIDKEIYYCDKDTDKLYKFDYGQYFKRVDYTGVVYERPFEFYRNMLDVFLDISDKDRIATKSITYVWGSPSKIKNPQNNDIAYDARDNKYYKFDSVSDSWQTVAQDAVIVPQTLFPYSHKKIN